jgi:hypothetical protein
MKPLTEIIMASPHYAGGQPLGPCNGKARFAGREQADQAQRKAKGQTDAYKCPACRGWHITDARQGRH